MEEACKGKVISDQVEKVPFQISTTFVRKVT